MCLILQDTVLHPSTVCGGALDGQSVSSIWLRFNAVRYCHSSRYHATPIQTALDSNDTFSSSPRNTAMLMLSSSMWADQRMGSFRALLRCFLFLLEKYMARIKTLRCVTGSLCGAEWWTTNPISIVFA